MKVKRFPVVAKKKIPADVEWVEAFVTQAQEDGLDRLAALCLFMFGTAARISEALHVTWADVDLATRTVVLRGAKPTPWERVAHLQPAVIVALTNLQSNRNPLDLVFGYPARDSVNKTWPNVAARAGIQPLTPHCCRHGFATKMLREGYDVKTVADHGGWKDAATVLRNYAHAIKDRTITDAVFSTNPARSAAERNITADKQRRKKA